LDVKSNKSLSMISNLFAKTEHIKNQLSISNFAYYR